MPFLLSTIGTLWWSASILVLVATAGLAFAQPYVRRRQSVDARPPVTVIIPTKGEEPGFALALESVLRQLRAEDELLVACAEPDGPSLPKARSCFARYPHLRARVHIGSKPEVRSPKMNNLLGPIADATNDIVLCKDANAILSDGQLDNLLRHLAPGVGLVTAVIRADTPQSLPARIEAAIMNGYHARLLYAASAVGLGFGLGKIMLFSRTAFNAAGGAAAMADAVHEDHAMGMLFARANLRTVIASGEVVQELGRRSLTAVWQRHSRWMICRRFDAPVTLLLEPFAMALTPAAVALAFSGPLLALGTLGVWYLLENALVLAKGWPAISLAGFIGRELLLPAMWIRAWMNDDVVWGGERMSARRVSGG